MTALQNLKGLVVIDEIQRRPELFPILRVLADRVPLPARFLILGSASPALLRQSSESLAGRQETICIGGLMLNDVGIRHHDRHWLRGGLPLSGATHAGAELDILLIKGRRRIGVEIKRADAPGLTPSMKVAMSDLSLQKLFVIYPGTKRYSLARDIEVLPMAQLLDALK